LLTVTAPVEVNAESAVAVRVVNVPVLAAVLPMVGGLDRSKVPPKVKLPEDVTVPDRDMPLTVPVPLTDVTVPTFASVDAISKFG